MKRVTQKTRILNHLDNQNSITPLEALNKFGCMRLAAVIWTLKDEGHNINTKTIYNKDSGKSYASYHKVTTLDY